MTNLYCSQFSAILFDLSWRVIDSVNVALSMPSILIAHSGQGSGANHANAVNSLFRPIGGGHTQQQGNQQQQAGGTLASSPFYSSSSLGAVSQANSLFSQGGGSFGFGTACSLSAGIGSGLSAFASAAGEHLHCLACVSLHLHFWFSLLTFKCSIFFNVEISRWCETYPLCFAWLWWQCCSFWIASWWYRIWLLGLSQAILFLVFEHLKAPWHAKVHKFHLYMS